MVGTRQGGKWLCPLIDSAIINEAQLRKTLAAVWPTHKLVIVLGVDCFASQPFVIYKDSHCTFNLLAAADLTQSNEGKEGGGGEKNINSKKQGEEGFLNRLNSTPI